MEDVLNKVLEALKSTVVSIDNLAYCIADFFNIKLNLDSNYRF